MLKTQVHFLKIQDNMLKIQDKRIILHVHVSCLGGSGWGHK